MGEITAMVIVATIAYTVYSLFELFARRKERIAIIEKLSNGLDPKALHNRSHIFVDKGAVGAWAIRIGLLLIGIGLGVALATIIDLSIMGMNYVGKNALYTYRNTINVLYPALAALFGGLGLVVAYFIENANYRKNNKLKKED
ncbi:MAG: DUF6249 domain-containing protein [Dysgonomonas sp.]|nr:DUF6249 domain-containing protein [Dysgonomonas sp.]